MVGTTGIEPVTPTMSTQCVDGNCNDLSKNRALNVSLRSRLGHGNHGHSLGGSTAALPNRRCLPATQRISKFYGLS